MTPHKLRTASPVSHLTHIVVLLGPELGQHPPRPGARHGAGEEEGPNWAAEASLGAVALTRAHSHRSRGATWTRRTSV